MTEAEMKEIENDSRRHRAFRQTLETHKPLCGIWWGYGYCDCKKPSLVRRLLEVVTRYLEREK